jgi:hypothetical protein
VTLSRKDRELGMHRPISRRDFLNGLAVGAGGLLAADPLLAALASSDEFAPEKAPGYYPPRADRHARQSRRHLYLRAPPA